MAVVVKHNLVLHLAKTGAVGVFTPGCPRCEQDLIDQQTEQHVLGEN